MKGINMYHTSRYKKDDIISILNPKQAAFYWSRGLEPIDIYPSVDLKGNPVIVFVFKRSETKELFTEWCERRPQQ